MQKLQIGLDLGILLDLGGFLEEMQGTKIKLKVAGFLRELTAKRPRSSSTSARSRDRGGMAARQFQFPATRTA
jgi:hypothetical protein